MVKAKLDRADLTDPPIKLIQTEAVRLLGTTQAQVSALVRCRPASVSVGKLMEFLTTLGQDVQVTVKPGARKVPAHMSVTLQLS